MPTSISREAQQLLASRLPGPPVEYPASDDLDGWRRHVAEHDASMQPSVDMAKLAPVDVEDREIDGVPVYCLTRHGTPVDDRRVVLEIHGGAFMYGGGDRCRAIAMGAATRIGAPVWAVDYRMAPDHPYPAGLDDCLGVYRALLRERAPEEIVVSGASAGGNLGVATVLRARDEGVPMPAAVAVHSPASDLTESGDTINTNRGLDPLLPSGETKISELYARGHDLRDPYVSPLFADFSKGFPPTILTTGTRDLFLSSTVLLHRAMRAAGVDAQLHVFEAAGHGGFLGMAPEDQEQAREVREFLGTCWVGSG